jgi:hypothetical protein
VRSDRRVVAGAHHVRECQQRRHQRVVLANRQHEQRAVGVGDAERLGLRPIDSAAAEEPAVHACRVQPFMAEDARAVGERERHHDDVAGLQRAHVGPDLLDDADGLMAHRLAGLGAIKRCVRPQIAAADAGARDADDRVGRLDDGGIRDVHDANVTRCEHDGGAHQATPSFNHVFFFSVMALREAPPSAK